MDTSFLRLRIKTLRERQDLSQEELAQQMGLKNRQSLSEIEQGERKLGAQELIKAAQALGIKLSDLTDPLRLVGEGEFSWRQKNVKPVELDAFESKAGQWIATYRYLSRLKGEAINSVMRRVALSASSSFEEAFEQGEIIGQTLGLGEVPALNLADVVENNLDTLVLHVDALPGISGAACRLEQLNVILINRHESAARRSFDMAHELFHLLTWDRMPPARLDGSDTAKKRVEQLADNFAAGLLMPRQTLAQRMQTHPLPAEPSLRTWLAQTAGLLHVSPSALAWRMVNLGHIPRARAERVLRAGEFTKNAGSKTTAPARMSQRFVRVLAWGIEQGNISVRHAASILAMSIDELGGLFAEHQTTVPFDL